MRRWSLCCVVWFAMAFGACTSSSADSESSEEPANEVPLITASSGSDPDGPNPEFVGSSQRGPWALRLWVGLWCDHGSELAGGSVFRVFVDDVALYRLDGTCSAPTMPPGSRPNAGAFAFTLGQGRHVVRVEAPNGETFTHALEMPADSWLTMHYTRNPQSGAGQMDFGFSQEPLYIDRSYEAATAPAPEAVRDYATGERAADYRRPSSELLEGSGPGAPAGADPEPRERVEAAARGASGVQGTRRPARRDDNPPPGWNDASMGVLAVRSQEPAEVWVDGRSTGRTTPVAAIPLRMGRYRVDLKRPGTDDVIRSFSVEIEPGSTRTLVN